MENVLGAIFWCMSLSAASSPNRMAIPPLAGCRGNQLVWIGLSVVCIAVKGSNIPAVDFFSTKKLIFGTGFGSFFSEKTYF